MFNTNQTSVAVNTKDQIIAIIRNHGPVIPKDLTKKLKIDTVFAGAHLSELVANKNITEIFLKDFIITICYNLCKI